MKKFIILGAGIFLILMLALGSKIYTQSNIINDVNKLITKNGQIVQIEWNTIINNNQLIPLKEKTEGN